MTSYSRVALVIFALIAVGCQAHAVLRPPMNATLAGAGRHDHRVGMIYVANIQSNSISGYFESDSGDVSPHILIQGPDTQLNEPFSLAVAADGRLFVGNSDVSQRGQVTPAVNVYAPGANGDASPSSVISCAGMLTRPGAMTLDREDELLLASDPDAAGYGISFVDASASGCVANFRLLAGLNTGINAPSGIAVDRSGSIYAAETAVDFGVVGISVFASTASGDAAPTRFISGPQTGPSINSFPSGLALDREQRIFVTVSSGNRILVYKHAVDGDAAPDEVLSGPLSGFNAPGGIAIGRDDKTYVPNLGSNSVTVYAAHAASPLVPLQAISGPNTGLDGTTGIALFEP